MVIEGGGGGGGGKSGGKGDGTTVEKVRPMPGGGGATRVGDWN